LLASSKRAFTHRHKANALLVLPRRERELAMGYWEQIGEENRKHRKKRAAMHPLRWKLSDALGTAFVIVASITLWAIMFSPFWLLFAG